MSNKDEALRAKELAEDWMGKSDFTTARRVAIKAQKMDATLENVVSRMIMVCDVHCAALEKSGDETDWYKILQVDQNADENTIKKQYRKLALYLHPDKNKLPGAESAFKTIGEAQRVLLDKEKRRIHDMRRKPVFRRPTPAPAPAPSFQPQQAPPRTFFNQHVFQTNVNSTTRKIPENQKKPQVQPAGFDGSSTFRTSCAFCHRKYEYQREFIDKPMSCLCCGKQYMAFQETSHGPTVQTTFASFQQSKAPTQETAKAPEKQPENSAKISSSKEGARSKKSGTSAENTNGKRKRKKMVESSDGSCSESSIECDKVPAGGQHSGSTGGQHFRRSVRNKQQVSYKENKGDDNNKEKDAESAEESDFRKKSHESQRFTGTLPNGINRKKKIKEDQVGSSRGSYASNAAKDSSSGSASDTEIFECTDPDFTNFEKLREVVCFKAGQTWAMYDDMDRMPRFYAIISKVIRKPSFLLKIQWLEAKPDDEKAIKWVHKELPISVGTFKRGGKENINGTPSFSHLIHCRTESTNDTFKVYPRKGETWALFKNWDINWSSGRRRSSHEYEYEFVEILSEYVEGVAIEVAFLRKLKGFTSVFCRIAPGDGPYKFQILPHELLRFSHSIPSTKLTGKEGNGVPVGSYELDTAALPQKIEEEAVPVSGEVAKSNQVHRCSPPSSEPDCIVIPNFQFHNFSADRLEGKFAPGQIWSLNSKEDGLPKCYAKIQQTIWRPVFKLQINLLEPKLLLGNVTQWRDKQMPVSCGKFILKEGQDEILTKVTGFSQQIKAEQQFRKNEYIVLPKTGEIWALYKNWTETIKAASLKKCEYEVVEVLDDNDSHIEVMMLEQVDGFISVFKEKVEGSIDVKKKIPRCELFRFSHCVPAFRLTGERDGALRGYVEIDPSALPIKLRRS
ncbi:hypothetical protein CARUB_v10000173mg [Capsella rubella]|uniref:J domain-containing protein n=1 Tax=Capsella rubella TaxID=81985 RepID=R0H8L8_9BRAS|nr:uncharacterized protein LOC17883844 [Capsella rubella]EOA19923.1 hypothetical protein CARUB_v10000173mg [Capsella rubella]